LTCLLCFAIGAALAMANDSTLNVDTGKPAGKVSPLLYGLMTEEINHSYDGGLYAELVQNRAFLDNHTKPVHWSVVQENGGAATIALDSAQPLNKQLPVSLRLEVQQASKTQPAGVANDGYWGIPVWPDTKYHASFYAKAGTNLSGSVTVSIQSDDGTVTYAKGTSRRLSASWQQYDLKLKTGTVTPTVKTRFVLSVDQPGTVWFDQVSLFPPTWDNQPNGFRKDLLQMLIDMNPKFLRFPGGNFVEGDTVATRFDWKQTIGPLTNRPGHRGPWGYRSTDGMGLLEFLSWCEDMKAMPLLAVYAGYNLRGTHIDAGTNLAPYVQDALDEIEYVTGPVSTPWGAQRAKDGHAKPYDLKYVEIGNEDWFDKSGSYDARFTQLYDAIKAKYPQLQLISTIGFDQPGVPHVKSRQPDMLDEHYYRPVDNFIADSPNHYEKYDRSRPKIFVGEWAAYETSFPPWDRRSGAEPPTPNMLSAIGDAAWMMDLERNSDYVLMQCYAPLLVNVNPGGRQWRPNLIGYDTMHVFGSPSYYAIQMFSQNIGDEILTATLTNSPVQCSATRNSHTGEVIIKLVNPKSEPQSINIALTGNSKITKARVITLSAAPDDTNSIDQPTKVVPVTSKVTNDQPLFNYTIPGHTITVLITK